MMSWTQRQVLIGLLQGAGLLLILALSWISSPLALGAMLVFAIPILGIGAIVAVLAGLAVVLALMH